jgi:DNA-binding GntR family transcriptional regulator
MHRPASAATEYVPATVPPPVERRALTDDVLSTLRKAILAGAFAPGDHIPEARTATQLGVSRVPVREAMLQLEREGLLAFDRRGAALVRELTAGDLEEIFSLRLALEPMGAELACRRLTREDANLLESNIARTRAAGRLLEVTLLDVEFHDLVMQTARHSRLLQCWLGLKPQLEVWLHRMHRQYEAATRHTRETTVREHLELLATLRSGNPGRAAARMRKHTEGWRDQLSRLTESANKL